MFKNAGSKEATYCVFFNKRNGTILMQVHTRKREERGREMKNIYHISIIVVIVALMATLSTSAYAANSDKKHSDKKNSGNKRILKKLERHDTDIKADIATHDGNMTTEHNDLSTEHGDLDTKLDDILEAVQNGGGSDAPVEKTGQTTPYAPGDDGDLERGVAWPNPRFTDNLDGTITDNLTGLIWDKDADRFGPQHWLHALTYCNNLADGAAGTPVLTDGSVAGDWHLANVNEYQSLVHYGVSSPPVPDTLGTGHWSQGDPFNNIARTDLTYVTSTAIDDDHPDFHYFVWGVKFDYGNTVITNIHHPWFSSWCVRCRKTP